MITIRSIVQETLVSSETIERVLGPCKTCEIHVRAPEPEGLNSLQGVLNEEILSLVRMAWERLKRSITEKLKDLLETIRKDLENEANEKLGEYVQDLVDLINLISNSNSRLSIFIARRANTTIVMLSLRYMYDPVTVITIAGEEEEVELIMNELEKRISKKNRPVLHWPLHMFFH